MIEKVGPSVHRQQRWHTLAGALSPGDCANLVNVMELLAPSAGGLAGRRIDSRVRRAELAWISDGPETAWIHLRTAEIFAAMNREAFGFDLREIAEDLQLTRYRAEIAGFYDWHQDRGERGLTGRRKLSLSVQLSPPDSYEGGELELDLGGRSLVAPRELGTAFAFPAYTTHRVRPVTRGVRYALVTWVHGPDFR